MTSPYEAELSLAKSATLKAGEIIRSYSNGNGGGRSANSATVAVKSGVDLVTEADTRVEKVITQMIKNAFPNDLIIGEEDQAESAAGKQDELFPTGRIWCVDPIDGTTNFVHNYPFVAVSIGFMDNSIPRVGVVYNPFTNSLYEAAQGSGKGTLLNDQPVRIDNVATSVKDCLLVNNIGHYRYDDFVDESTDRVKKWLRAGLRGYRASGSAAQNLAHVASGQVSCYYEHGYGGPWDVCAGMVLVREAGGVVLDARELDGDGKELEMRFGKGSVCAGSKEVVQDVLRVAGTPIFTFTES